MANVQGVDLSARALAKTLREHLHFSGSPAGSYNLLQRLVYLGVVFVLFPATVWTGLAMSPAIVAVSPGLMTVWGGHQSARTLHFFCTILLVLFVLAHIAMVWLLSPSMVARPTSLSLAELRSYPSGSQITQLACEEGWSYVAEWIGVPLFYVLHAAGIRSGAKYVVYHSMEKGWTDSVDMSDALHPQTFLTYGMNGGTLPVGFGGPLRMRVPRQLGYKSVKLSIGLR